MRTLNLSELIDAAFFKYLLENSEDPVTLTTSQGTCRLILNKKDITSVEDCPDDCQYCTQISEEKQLEMFDEAQKTNKKLAKKTRGKFDRLSINDRVKICELAQEGMSTREISKEIGVGESSISEYRRCKTRKNCQVRKEYFNNKPF